MLKHLRIGHDSLCRSSGLCLTWTSRQLQKEAQSSRYRVTPLPLVTESVERVQLVIDRGDVTGRPFMARLKGLDLEVNFNLYWSLWRSLRRLEIESDSGLARRLLLRVQLKKPSPIE